jgi:hypothetical protein
VPEHQEQQAAVAGLVAAALGGSDELADLGESEVFSGFHYLSKAD